MRAWHLLLAVLATFQTIVQVASTEDNSVSSRFVQAIQPIKKDIIVLTNDGVSVPVHGPPSTALQQQPKPPMTTALTDFPANRQSAAHRSHKKSDSDNKISEQAQTDNRMPRPLVQSVESRSANAASENEVIEITDFTEIETNALGEQTKQIVKQQIEDKYLENLTEDKENYNAHPHKKHHKQSHNNNSNKAKMALSVKEERQTEQTNERHTNQKTPTTENVTTALSTFSQRNQQETQPASQPQSQQHQLQHQQQQQHYQQHHHHRHQHHRHHQHQHKQHHRHQQQQQQSHAHHKQQQQQQLQMQHQQLPAKQFSDNSPSSAADSISSDTSSPEAAPISTTTTSANIIPITPMDIDVVAEDDEPQVDAVIPEDGPRTYSNKEIIGDKVSPDPSTLVEIENSLLSLFNMKRPPKIDRSKIIIPEAMKQLYAQIMGHELNSVNIPKPGLLTKSANTVRSFTHQDSKIDDRFPHHHRFRLYFDIKSIPAEEKLKAAELQLTRDAISHVSLNPRLANRTRYQVLVYDITRVGVRGKREPSYLLLDNKTIRLNSTETVSLDVQPAVDRWLATPKKNFGLLVEVRTSRSLKPAPHPHVRLRRSADEEHNAWLRKQPLLFAYTDDGRHKPRSIRDVSQRSKRAGGHHRRSHRRKNSEESCRRHSLYVDFHDVGWSDWIVAPPGYDAFYCQGRCPFPLAEHMNSTNHAVVQTIVNNVSPEKVPKACCVPTQLEGISMLYLNDQSTVVLKNYQDMTVVGCGCR